MTLVRRATLFCAVGLLAASAAMAGVPSASTSTQPAGITLVGMSALNVPDPTTLGNAAYTIRDAASNPVPGSIVIMNFTACTDIHLCASFQPASMTVNCAANTITGVTDATGLVTFKIVGGGKPAGAAVTTACISVTADGVALNTIRDAVFDINGAGGVTAADLTLLKFDLNTNPLRTRSDVNKSGSVTAADYTLEKFIFNAGNATTSCAAAPPPGYCN